jgi:protein TonB
MAMIRMWIGIAVMVAAATPAAAQTGHIAGVARDPSGGVLPGVQVRAVTKDDTGETARTVRTDGVGRYDLSLDPGTWTVTAALPGFATRERTVTLLAGAAEQWNPELQVGSLQETVTITADMKPARTVVSAPQQAPPGGASRGTPTPTFLPPTPPAGARGPVRVGGNIKPPRKVVNVNPGYPAAAIAQGVSGVVILEATIGANGKVTGTRVLRSIPLLDQAAVDAVGQWEFSPTLLNGQPVPVIMTVTLNFASN